MSFNWLLISYLDWTVVYEKKRDFKSSKIKSQKWKVRSFKLAAAMFLHSLVQKYTPSGQPVIHHVYFSIFFSFVLIR